MLLYIVLCLTHHSSKKLLLQVDEDLLQKPTTGQRADGERPGSTQM